MSYLVGVRFGSPRTDFKKRSIEPSKEFTFRDEEPYPINELYNSCKEVRSPILSIFSEHSTKVDLQVGVRFGSPRTDFKKRSIEPSKEFTFRDEEPYPINELYNFCKEVRSPILSIFSEHSTNLLATEILKNSKSDEVFGMILVCVKHLLEFLDDGFTISRDYMVKFYSMAREVWANPHFAKCLGATIEKDSQPIGLILLYANKVSPTLRITRMRADPSFKPCLRGIRSANQKTILRVFFSFLFSHWAEKSELTELDKRMGKDFFGQRMAFIAKYNYNFVLKGLGGSVEDFVLDIEEASQAKDMEPFRKWLVSRYGRRGDMVAVLGEVKTDISNFMDTCQKRKHARYDGKKARIRIRMTNGEYTDLFFEIKAS